MCCHGKGHRRGDTSLTSRAINQMLRGSTRKGGTIRLLGSLSVTGQPDCHQRAMYVCTKLWARKLSKPRSTRGSKVAEFEGGVFRLGRGGAPLFARALLRATMGPTAADAKGILANLCMVGDVHGILTAKLMGSKGCLGRPVARREGLRL